MAIQPLPATNNALFYDLEVAMLDAIATQYPDLQDGLLAQFRAARVTDRYNSGAGFVTRFEVDRSNVAPVKSPRVVGTVWANIDDFEHEMIFLVFTQDGYAKALEGATTGDGTKNVDFSRVRFRLQV